MSNATLELAKERHLSGDLPGARELYDRILVDEPDNAAVLFRVGVLEIQAGRNSEALGWISRAIAQDSVEPRYHRGLGQTLTALSQFADATSAYRKLIELEPDAADAHFALGSSLQSQRDHRSSILAYRKALSLHPDYVDALTNLGAALGAVGQTDEAVECFRQAIVIEPGVATHRLNLGSTLCQQRKFAEGADALRQAVELDRNRPEAFYNLGLALTGLCQLKDAAEGYRRAISLRPAYADAWNNLGAVCKEMGDFPGAATAFENAATAQPDLIAAYNNSGCLLRTLGRMDEAEGVFRGAIERGLKSAALYSNLANVLKDSGNLDEAIACYRTAIDLDPNDAGIHANLIYSLSFQATDGRVVLEECRQWNDRHAAALRPVAPVYHNDRSPDRRLRIGYVSGDLRDHCQSLFTIPLLSHHDRNRFEIHCYATVERPDALTQRISQMVDVWRDARALSDLELASQIRADRIDVLVDLGMHMATSRPLVFARAPAPVQVAWLAYPGTTGMNAVQYRLTDPRLDPAGFDDQYVEQSIRLPDTFWCYDPLSAESVNSLPALSNGFVTFGCLNNPCKLTDQTLSMWSGVMRALPTARLQLLAPPGAARDRLARRLVSHGIGAERVILERFLPRSRYLQKYHEIDLGLDTLPYNGHTTSLDSFWMGVPVITRVGATAVGRGGLSQLFNLDHMEFAADTDNRFVQIATELAADLPRLERLRAGLRSRMETSPLMNGERFARNIETAYRAMWKAWSQHVLPRA